jgi:hypothetical protein
MPNRTTQAQVTTAIVRIRDLRERPDAGLANRIRNAIDTPEMQLLAVLASLSLCGHKQRPSLTKRTEKLEAKS